MLRSFAKLKTADPAQILMPMFRNFPIPMLSCARLGVIHSVVFGGFSGEACGLRAADSGSRVLIYADGYHRSEEHTSELQSHSDLVCRLLLEKKKKKKIANTREQSLS